MRLSRPKHGTVAAYLALFLALGGTSYAAASLPRHSVGTSQLRAHAVTSSRIASNAVTSSKVRNGSLTSRDFKSGQAPKGPAGPAGPAGPTGPQGPAGGGAQVGYANVLENGTVSPTNSVDIGNANITHNVAGGYCFAGLPKAPSNVQVTPQIGFFGPVTANAALGVAGGCPAGTQVSVTLISITTAGPVAVNNPFFISID